MKPKTAKIFTESYIKGQTFKDVLSKRDTWEELEKIYNGSLNASTSISGDVAALTLEIQYRNHSLILKETDAMPLKIEVRFNLTKKHEFNIYLKDWTDKFLFLFGAKSIKTGDVEFDNKYGIQSKEPELVITFLKDYHISEKIMRNNLYSLILSYDKKTKAHTLLTVKDRNTKNIEALTELVDLESRIIDSFIKQDLIHC